MVSFGDEAKCQGKLLLSALSCPVSKLSFFSKNVILVFGFHPALPPLFTLGSSWDHFNVFFDMLNILLLPYCFKFSTCVHMCSFLP